MVGFHIGTNWASLVAFLKKNVMKKYFMLSLMYDGESSLRLIDDPGQKLLSVGQFLVFVCNGLYKTCYIIFVLVLC